ncbi:MAG: hypothetical protein ACTIKR_04345 [Advenella sp.]|uniref:hypothetical protein n=1 Tax=Advenella sp. FME57 TaxID=2742604 RepID=UPI001868071E|nr:hypothetical protein [Advenella sp. FME57]
MPGVTGARFFSAWHGAVAVSASIGLSPASRGSPCMRQPVTRLLALGKQTAGELGFESVWVSATVFASYCTGTPAFWYAP